MFRHRMEKKEKKKRTYYIEACEIMKDTKAGVNNRPDTFISLYLKYSSIIKTSEIIHFLS